MELRRWAIAASAVMALATLACPTAGPRRERPAPPGGGVARSPGAADAGTLRPQIVAQGDSIFHGQVGGGTCFQCHGKDARGTPAAPNLADARWDNGDGSYQSILNIVQNGVPPHPEHGRGGMPAMGGVLLTPERVRSVAAYVYSLRRRGPEA